MENTIIYFIMVSSTIGIIAALTSEDLQFWKLIKLKKSKKH